MQILCHGIGVCLVLIDTALQFPSKFELIYDSYLHPSQHLALTVLKKKIIGEYVAISPCGFHSFFSLLNNDVEPLN